MCVCAAAVSSSSLQRHLGMLSHRVHSLSQWIAYAQQRVETLREAEENQRHSETIAAPASSSLLMPRVSDELASWMMLYDCAAGLIQDRQDKLQEKINEYRRMQTLQTE